MYIVLYCHYYGLNFFDSVYRAFQFGLPAMISDKDFDIL